MNTVQKILGDIDKFDSVANWLNDVQRDYGVEQHYATSAANTLSPDMYILREVFAQRLGEELLKNNRKDLDRIAKRS